MIGTDPPRGVSILLAGVAILLGTKLLRAALLRLNVSSIFPFLYTMCIGIFIAFIVIALSLL